MTPTLSVIIINWNVQDLLKRALSSVYASWGAQPGLEVIVVDNGSQDNSVAMTQQLFPQAQVITNRHNLGYAGGTNQGFNAAQGDLRLVLNPDVEIVEDALICMVDFAKKHPEAGMIGPQLLWPDGSVQSSRRRFPTLPVLFLESTWLQKLLPQRTLQHYYVQQTSDAATQDVDWITGAAMLTRCEVFEQVGGMDEAFFMYSEELDWCRRVKEAGWRIVYYPQAQIIHYEGKSSEQVVAARHIYFQSSKVHYTRKYHGPFIAELLRHWLMMQYTAQIGIEGSKWLVGHRRELRTARLRAYRQVLKSKLRQSGPIEMHTKK